MKKGEIFLAKKEYRREDFHPIVFIENIDKDSFKACILSHEKGKGNIKMLQEHFLKKDKNGTNYTIIYDDTHLVIKTSFIKINHRINCNNVVGCLTKEGIEFIEMYCPEKLTLHKAHIRKL